MSRTARYLARLGALALLCIAVPPAAAQEESAPELEDGIYLISRAGTRRAEVVPVFDNERLLIHDHRFLEKATARSTPQQLVVVGPFPEVPLVLAAEPVAESDEEGRSNLRLQLAEEQRVKLEDLTRARSGRGLALVVDGAIVTASRIHAPITDGSLLVAGCREGAAEHLVRQLRDNVARTPEEGRTDE